MLSSGGPDALLDQAGVDATSAFEDVGHSREARAVLETLQIGKADGMVRAHVSFACSETPFSRLTCFYLLYKMSSRHLDDTVSPELLKNCVENQRG